MGAVPLCCTCTSSVPSVAGKSPVEVWAALVKLDHLYGWQAADPFVDSHSAASAQQAKEMLGDETGATYGEIPPLAVAQLLSRLEARPGQRFYDVGSGTGKIVVLAWLLGLDATGIELASERAAALERVIQKLPSRKKGSPGIRSICAKAADADFTDADILYSYCAAFPQEAVEDMAQQARRLRPDAAVVTTVRLSGPEFVEEEPFTCPNPWGNRKVSFVVQTVARRDPLLA